MRTGGQLIVDTLEANGVERIYSVPGESYLAVLDALHDSSIENIVCRQEGGAAMMASGARANCASKNAARHSKRQTSPGHASSTCSPTSSSSYLNCTSGSLPSWHAAAV